MESDGFRISLGTKKPLPDGESRQSSCGKPVRSTQVFTTVSSLRQSVSKHLVAVHRELRPRRGPNDKWSEPQKNPWKGFALYQMTSNRKLHCDPNGTQRPKAIFLVLVLGYLQSADPPAPSHQFVIGMSRTTDRRLPFFPHNEPTLMPELI